MRSIAVALLLLLALLAGCATKAPADPTAAAEPAAAEPVTEEQAFAAQEPAAQEAANNGTLEGAREFCESADDCTYWDNLYHQYVVYDLDTTTIDVVLVPPVGAPDQIAAQRLAVQQWADGIEALAAPWFRDAFQVNVYAVGVDIPSIDAVSDPEVVVISTSAVGLVGIGLEPKQLACQIIEGGAMRADYGGHSHDGNEVFAVDCTGTGFVCFALNVGGADAFALYDLVAHEVGHCLGAGHVGDALDFRARYAPVEDIMSYQNNATKVHCVSNMNVRVLEGVYGHLLGRHPDDLLPRGSYFPFPPALYKQAECANPA
ncbi:MAG: hypothetical protein AABX89_03605 [Candidatus Thermoplasmatota archaeon]